MADRYTVTWTVDIEAEDPLGAAREAYAHLYSLRSRPRRFMVGHPKITEALGPGHALAVELPKENPLGRLPARIEEDGVSISWGGDLEVDEVGADPRVLCFGCGRESGLPLNFRWAEGESE
jgi:hypothetical protein